MKMRSHWLYALVPLFFLAVFPAAAEQEKDDPLRNAALSGDTAAQLKLASEFFFGTDARPRNPVLAVYWYRRAAELGSAEGAYNLGVCYEKGWGVEHPSLVRAGRCFDEAAKGGLPEARLRKALLRISGIPDDAEEKETLPGTPADPAGALRLLRDLAGTGYLPADRELGRMILRDAALRQSCGTEARQSLTRAADSGDVESLLMLAACYEDGVGGAGDAKEAVACYERAVKLGSAEAKVPLAAAYEYGLGVAPDPVRAFRLVREAAEAGSARAQVRLGDYYLNGDQVAQSISEALALYRKAFDAGYLSAAVKLGRCAELGIGSDPEPVRAAELYGIAARAGDADGQYAFGRCHLKGIGMEPDAAGAVFWFKTATAVGQLDAVRELGICYLTGTGVEKDEAEGSRLIEAAAASGDPEALVILSNN